MIGGLSGSAGEGHDPFRDAFSPSRTVWCGAILDGDFLMQWQTPTASDFRFGFEITMYVAAR